MSDSEPLRAGTERNDSAAAPIPERLRRATAELAEVRPLLPPSLRTLAVTAVLAAASLALAPLISVSSKPLEIEPLPAWMAIAFEAAIGLVLVWLAFREAVPGMAFPFAARIVALILAPVALGLAIWIGPPTIEIVTSQVADLRCAGRGLLIAAPAAGLALWLLSRAYPLRPPLARVAALAGVGLLAEPVVRLACLGPFTHAVQVHAGAMLVPLIAIALVDPVRLGESRRG